MNEGARQIDTGRRGFSSAANSAQQSRQIEAAQARGIHVIDDVGKQHTLLLRQCADVAAR